MITLPTDRAWLDYFAGSLDRDLAAWLGPGRHAATFFTDNVVVVATARLQERSPDILVYVAGTLICGSGGCNAYLFGSDDYRPLAGISPARLPIRALDRIHHGRWDIGVPARGVGVRDAYVGALAFDGRRYAANPTLTGVPRAAPGGGRLLMGLPGAVRGQCRLR